jgi:excisionase family DNA binding protein
MPNTSTRTRKAATDDDVVGTIITADDKLIGCLKLSETATYLRLSEPTIHRLVDRGLLRPNRATRHMLFPISEIQRFLKDHQTD